MSPLPLIAWLLVDLSALPGNNCLASIRRHAPSLLEDYRYPAVSDLDGYWAFYVEEYGSVPFCDAGDLNADGVVDYLAVLIARKPPGVLVVAMVSGANGSRSAATIFESHSAHPAPYEFVVEIVPPGLHKYICAYTVDNAESSPPVRLAQPAVRFWTRPPGQAQGLHYLFRWHAAEGTFARSEPCTVH